STFDRSTPAFAHTKPWAVSLTISSPRRRSTRTDSRSTSTLWESGSSGSTASSRPSALDTTFWVTTTTSPARSSARSAIRSARTSPARISPSPVTGTRAIGPACSLIGAPSLLQHRPGQPGRDLRRVHHRRRHDAPDPFRLDRAGQGGVGPVDDERGRQRRVQTGHPYHR